ncbi:MAG: hypothetical protein OXL41_06335 [Nitrospinae bacterium]|nr:hypothetical protein [Nitrospinota bacterium]
MALSPWPNAGTQGRTAALAKLRRRVSSLKDDELAAELGEAAAALIEEYAPGAPAAVKDEAVIRYVGYLKQSPPAAIQKISTGSVDVEFRALPPASSFQLSGARALLTRWKVRRGGVIG